MFIIRNVLALIEIIVEMSSMCEHYNCIHNIHSTKIVTISAFNAFEAIEMKKNNQHYFFFILSLFNVSISTNRNEEIIIKKVFFFSLYLQENVCTNDYNRQKKIFSCEYIRSFELDAISIYQHICRKKNGFLAKQRILSMDFNRIIVMLFQMIKLKLMRPFRS